MRILPTEFRDAFESMIDASVTAYYEGELCPIGYQNEHCIFAPSDPDEIRALLVALWDGRVTTKEIENAVTRITDLGGRGRVASEWPRAQFPPFDEDECSLCGRREELESYN